MKCASCVWFLALLVSVGFAADDAPQPAVVLKLNAVVTDPETLDFQALPKLSGTHAVVCEPTDELKFQLHDYLIHHDGKYWCLFSHGPEVEDWPTQFVSFSTSDDGLKWSPPKPVMPRPAAPYAYIARGFWLCDGELFMMIPYC